jgi:hypothetical protein
MQEPVILASKVRAMTCRSKLTGVHLGPAGASNLPLTAAQVHRSLKNKEFTNAKWLVKIRLSATES